MRILHLVHSVNPVGGGPIEAVKQLTLAAPAEHRIEIVSLDAPDAPWVAGFPIAATHLGPSRGGYGWCPRLPGWLAANKSRFDVAVVHGLWQHQGLATWRALRRSGPPYVVMPHGMLDPWFKRHYPLKHLKKLLYWPWAEYRVLRDASAVLFTAEEERVAARASFALYRAREQVVNFGTAAPPAGVDVQRQAFLAAFPALATTRNLLFLGRIQVKKGCDLLLEAFAGMAVGQPDLRLVMAGPDQDGWQAALSARAAAAGIADRVVWTGMLQGDAKWGAFRCAEAFVLPSHQENFGIAVAEALACGVPVLISNRVNIWREVQADGAALVADDTPAGTASLLSGWLALTAAARADMGARALRCFAARFDLAQASAGFHAALEAVARSASTAAAPAAPGLAGSETGR